MSDNIIKDFHTLYGELDKLLERTNPDIAVPALALHLCMAAVASGVSQDGAMEFVFRTFNRVYGSSLETMPTDGSIQ